MPRILIVEKSPLVAVDILETVRDEFPGFDALTVNSIEDAEIALSEPDRVRLCIVSGSSTRERMIRLGRALDTHSVGTVTISDDDVEPGIFAPNAVHISRPFTSDMLVEALRRVNGDGGRPELP